MDGEFFSWSESYVEYDGWHFCPAAVTDKKSTHHATGNASVEPNSFYFTGNRQFNVDAPIYVTGQDVIRFVVSRKDTRASSLSFVMIGKRLLSRRSAQGARDGSGPRSSSAQVFGESL
jgi:hypothetical protein